MGPGKEGFSYNEDLTEKDRVRNHYVKAAVIGFVITGVLCRAELYAAAAVVGGVSLYLLFSGLDARGKSKPRIF